MLCGEPKLLDPVEPALPGRGRRSAVLAGLGQRQAAVRAFTTSQRWCGLHAQLGNPGTSSRSRSP